MVLPNNNQGIVLIYSLLIIGLITAIALTMSIIIVNELKLTSSSTDATLAYYAAESGIEKGLYTVKIKRNDPGSNLAGAVGEIKNFAATLSNDSNFDNEKTVSKTAVIESRQIVEGQYVQADYYDFDNPLAPVAGSVAKSLVVTNTGNDPLTWVEVSWIAWRANGTLGESTAAKKIIGPTDLKSGWTISNLDVFGASFDPVGYRVRVKALFGDLSSVSVTPYIELGGEGDQVNLPSTVEIIAIGEHGSFKQSLTATVPWKIPLFGLYDYVLFSEESLIKTLILSRQIYTSGPIEVEADNITSGECTGCSGVAGDCGALGWNAVCCAAGATCDPSLGTCTVDDGTSNSWVLPIPDYVPADEDYYISIRAKYDNSAGKMRIILGDACKEVPAPTLLNEYVICTLPDADFNTIPNSNIKFDQIGFGGIDIDWYMISTFKVYDDCAGVIACTAPTPDCGNCVCESGENCPADDIDCTAPAPVCQASICNNGCGTVDFVDNTQDPPDCSGGDVCCGGSCSTPICTGEPCGSDPDQCNVYQCNNPSTCGASCDYVRTKTQAQGDCSLTLPSDGCCPEGCNSSNDTDCPPSATPPPREYLRSIAFDESLNDLSAPPLFHPGLSMRNDSAWISQRDGGLRLTSVWGADTLNVWAVGDGGQILNTNDGGSTWIFQTSNTPNHLRGIHGIDDLNLIAVGYSGDIVYTNDGGFTWALQDSSPTTEHLYDVWAFDANNVWFVGNKGAIYKCASNCFSDDPTWNDQSPGGSDLRGIVGLDASNLWAVGFGGSVYDTENGGSTWVASTWTGRSGDEQLNGIDAVSIGGTDYVWAVGKLSAFGGDNFILFSTGTGSTTGDTWSTQSTPALIAGSNLFGIAAYDENGVARASTTGVGGRAAYYDGSSWRQQQTGLNGLLGAFAIDYKNVWAVGDSGAIRFGNVPGGSFTVGDGFDQYWYTREFISYDPPAGNYIGNINVFENTGANNRRVYITMSFGTCDGGCNDAGDFTTLGTSSEFQVNGSSPEFNSLDMGSVDINCTSCRLWTRLWTSRSTSWSFKMSASGREFDYSLNDQEKNSYLEIPIP
ncbi:hypothetical protein IID19_05280 [Patescibacteria group bacterium]|nr:hypothetical protein [Patescibacteria group bacterium]